MNNWNWKKIRLWIVFSVPLIMGVDSILFDGEIVLLRSGYFDHDSVVGTMIIVTCVWWFVVEVVFGSWLIKILGLDKRNSSSSKD